MGDVEDTKMEEGGESKEAPDKEEKKEESPPPLPPLEAAAQRLERLLGGGLTDKDRMLDFYTNPVKVVRRWLGTSSGAAADATVDDVKSAAAKLLNPEGPCAAGRALLVSSDQRQSMATDVHGDQESTTTYLSLASAREVESWLLSLACRLLWKQSNHSQAQHLAQKAIQIVMGHLDETAMRVATASSSSSLYPLLARLYRFRSLAAESIRDPALTASLRADMAKAHNMASLRRDADTQATLLNSMLRDLLLSSQGKHYPSSDQSTYEQDSHGFISQSSIQWNKRKSSSPTPPFPRRHRTTNSADTCTTVVASKPYVSNTPHPTRTSASVCARPPPTRALDSALPHNACWWWCSS